MYRTLKGIRSVFCPGLRSVLISLLIAELVCLPILPELSIAYAGDGVSKDASTEHYEDWLNAFGGDAECDTQCVEVVTDANNTCKKKGPDGKDTEVCRSKRASQVYTQCLAYNQAGWSAFFDSYMIGLDTIAATTCTAACAVMVLAPASSAMNPTVLACEIASIVDGAADVANMIALHTMLGQGPMGSNSAEQFSTIMGIAGMAMGGAGLMSMPRK